MHAPIAAIQYANVHRIPVASVERYFTDADGNHSAEIISPAGFVYDVHTDAITVDANGQLAATA